MMVEVMMKEERGMAAGVVDEVVARVVEEAAGEMVEMVVEIGHLVMGF